MGERHISIEIDIYGDTEFSSSEMPQLQTEITWAAENAGVANAAPVVDLLSFVEWYAADAAAVLIFQGD